MNQEKTKHKFHKVLKWVANGEQIEYLTSTGEWVTEQSKDILWCITQHPERYKQDRFRIKPKPQIVRADVTYVVFGDSGNCTVDLSCENTETKQLLYKMAQQRERVVIISEQCYNDLLGNSTLNLKGN